MSYYTKIEPLLKQYFNGDQDKILSWLYTPNYLWDRFTPITLILTGDERPLLWIEKQLDLEKYKNRFK